MQEVSIALLFFSVEGGNLLLEPKSKNHLWVIEGMDGVRAYDASFPPKK